MARMEAMALKHQLPPFHLMVGPGVVLAFGEAGERGRLLPATRVPRTPAGAVRVAARSGTTQRAAAGRPVAGRPWNLSFRHRVRPTPTRSVLWCPAVRRGRVAMRAVQARPGASSLR